MERRDGGLGGETPSYSLRRHHSATAASQTAPLSGRRAACTSQRRETNTGGTKGIIDGGRRCAVRCSGCKQTRGGGGGSSSRIPQGWSSSGRAVFTFLLLCNCTRGLNRAERGRLHHFLSPSLLPSFLHLTSNQPQSPERPEEKDRNKQPSAAN